MKLPSNVLDKLESIQEEQGRDFTLADVASLLKQLGHPEQVAASFLPPKQLVTPELFPLYKQILYYGVIFMFVLEIIKFGVVFLSSGHLGIADLVFGFASKSLLMFASVTGVFYILSNPPGGKPYFNPYQCWIPEKLPPISRSWQRISAGEQAVDFASDLFFLLLLNYSLWVPDAKLANLTFSFSEAAQAWIPGLSIVVAISLGFGVWNLFYPYWTIPKLWVEAAINSVMAIILLLATFISPLIVDSLATEERMQFINIANGVINKGLFWVAIWLLFMAAWNLYRAWQLTRSSSLLSCKS